MEEEICELLSLGEDELSAAWVRLEFQIRRNGIIAQISSLLFVFLNSKALTLHLINFSSAAVNHKIPFSLIFNLYGYFSRDDDEELSLM